MDPSAEPREDSRVPSLAEKICLIGVNHPSVGSQPCHYEEGALYPEGSLHSLAPPRPLIGTLTSVHHTQYRPGASFVRAFCEGVGFHNSKPVGI